MGLMFHRFSVSVVTIGNNYIVLCPYETEKTVGVYNVLNCYDWLMGYKYFYNKLAKTVLVLLLLCSGTLLAEGSETGRKQPLESIRLQLKWLHQFQFAGYYAALEQGYYREAGLDVTLLEHPLNRSPVDVMLDGAAEYVVMGSDLLVHRSQGVPLVALAAISQHDPLALLVTRASGIEGADDLRGKRVMLDHGAHDAAIQAMLVKAGLREEDYTLQKTSYDPLDLLNGNTDAFNAYVTDQGFLLDEAGVDNHYIHPTRYGIDFYSDILTTTDHEVENHPDRVKRFLGASLKGWAYAMSHTEAVIDLIMQQYNSQNRSRAHLQYEARKMQEVIQPLLVQLGYMHEERWKHIHETFSQLGFLERDVAIHEILYKEEAGEQETFYLDLLMTLLAVLVLVLFGLFIAVRANQHLTRKLEMVTKQARFEELVNNATDAVFLVSGYRFIDCNPATLKMFGCARREDIVGHTPIDFSPSRQSGGEASDTLALQKISDAFNGTPQRFEWLHSRLDGSLFDAEVILNRLDIHGDHFIQAIVRDISERKKMEKALIEEKERAERASKAKDEFMASMSHELRTPLASIIGNSEYLLEKQSDPVLQEALQAIEMAGRTQLALVNDILDMSRIESGKFTIDEKLYDLTVLLENIEHMFGNRVRDAGLELTIRQQNRETFMLVGDAQRISQILINLIGNAIKFTERGAVTLTTRVENEWLIFAVEDSGIGMSQEILRKLFSRFEQADGSISRRFGGSGLGLFISLNLAELMGGTIKVSSREGVGSNFELYLPYSRSEFKQRELEMDAGAADEMKFKGHVLAVEDTPALQLLERRILERMGLTVVVADNGEEAVRQVALQHFDLVLMDMQMPVMDGIEATEVMRKEGVKAPIIALTANVMQKHREQFHQAGCDGFLGKPIDKLELIKVLQRYLHRSDDTQQYDAEQ